MLLPVMAMLLPAVNVTVLPTELASTAVPLAKMLPKANAEFCSKVRAVVPMMIGSLVVSFHCVSAYTVPSVTMTIIPASISPVVLPSVVRTQVPFEPEPTVST